MKKYVGLVFIIFSIALTLYFDINIVVEKDKLYRNLYHKCDEATLEKVKNGEENCGVCLKELTDDSLFIDLDFDEQNDNGLVKLSNSTYKSMSYLNKLDFKHFTLELLGFFELFILILLVLIIFVI